MINSHNRSWKSTW